MCAGKRNKWLLCIVAFAMVVCTLLTMVQPIVAYAAENEISFDSTNVLDDLKSSTVNGQPFDIKDYPNAYAQYENEITLPLYSRLTDEQVDYIIENFVRIVGEY